MNWSRSFNWLFGFGLLGWAVFTWVTPVIIKILFTPPVSFGVNCEPAVEWSMSKLVWTQLVGIVLFMILGLVTQRLFSKKPKKTMNA